MRAKAVELFNGILAWTFVGLVIFAAVILVRVVWRYWDRIW